MHSCISIKRRKRASSVLVVRTVPDAREAAPAVPATAAVTNRENKECYFLSIRFPQYIKKRLSLQRAAFYNRNTVVELYWGALADPAIIVLRIRNADELCRTLMFSEIE